MAELRESAFQERWVVLSAARGNRPDDFKSNHKSSSSNSSCPFCPGNEHETGAETLALLLGSNAGDGDAGDNKQQARSKWDVRVVYNLFPAVTSSPPMPLRSGGAADYIQDEGVGSHEVVVETPQHGVSFTELPLEQVTLVLNAFRLRMKSLKQDGRFSHIQVFKNNGKEAGASLLHSHSQIISLPVVPPAVEQQAEACRRHFEKSGSCLVCDNLKYDMSSTRVIEQSSFFVSLAPFAPRMPFETWIVPIRHSSDFDEMTDIELDELAAMLHSTLQRIVQRLGNNTAYNYYIQSKPCLLEQKQHVQDRDSYAHWYLCILPRTVTWGGFELATSCNINHTSPEEAANILRG